MSTTLSNASSNFELHWVKPTLPTALNGREFLPLPSSDLIFFATELTWLVPGLLDICRLKEALSLTLRDFPHFCGLLSLDENTKSRRLLLSNKPVRLTVGKNTTVELTDEVMNESHPDIADTLPIAFQASEEIAREPLVRFRVTEWMKTGETTITITCCHLLTDGPGEIHFFNTWSAYYTQQTPPPAPTFEKFLDAPPSCPRNRITSTLSAVSLLAIDYPAEELIKMNMPRFAATERVELGFTKKQLEKLKRKANKSTGETTLSTMDALAGYLATILNRVDDAPVQEINHVIGYRGASAVSDGSYKPPPLTSTGNVVITIQSPRIEATRSTPLGPYAQLLRSSVRRSLSPDNLRDIVGLSEELYTRAYETKRYADYGLHAGNMGLSSLYKTLVHRAHFGFEGQVRFYSNTTFERYFRVLPANPVKHVDNAGIVHWENREGGATVLFRVRKGLCEKVLALVKEDMANLQCAASKL